VKVEVGTVGVFVDVNVAVESAWVLVDVTVGVPTTDRVLVGVGVTVGAEPTVKRKAKSEKRLFPQVTPELAEKAWKEFDPS
jgi:hypothetical protein